MIVEDVVVLFIEEQKYEHVTNNDVEWVVDFYNPPPYYPGLFTTYKAGDFGIVKWVILVTQKLWELVMCASKQMLVAL